MLGHPLFFGGKLPVIAEGNGKVLVISNGNRHPGILKGTHKRLFKCLLGVPVFHIARSGAKFGNTAAFPNGVPAHLLLRKTPDPIAQSLERNRSKAKTACHFQKTAVIYRHHLGTVQRIHHGPHYLPASLPFGIRITVQGKDINNHTVGNIQICLIGLDQRCLIVPKSGECIVILVMASRTCQSIAFFISIFLPQLHQTVVIFPGHKKIQVVIPGNKSPVAHRTDAAAAAEIA